MPADEGKAALAQARALEAKGDKEGALKLYMRAGAGDDVVRLLIAARRFAEAGKLLLTSVGGSAAKLAGLDTAKKKRALQAGICFANGGESRQAVEIFLALGEKARAVELLEKEGDYATATRVEQASPSDLAGMAYAPAGQSGQTATTLAAAQKLEAQGKHEAALAAYQQLKQLGHAGRMAHLLKRPAQAAELFEQGGMPYEAAVCYREAGDTGKCLDNLMRVPRDDKRYRGACLHAIKLATELNLLDFQLEHFLGKLVAGGPTNEHEVEVFFTLGQLYERHDFAENAREIYQKILDRDPGHKGADARLEAMETEARNEGRVFEKIVKEEQSFRAGIERSGPSRSRRASAAGTGADVALPDLPALPGTPGSLSAPARPGSPARETPISANAVAHAPTHTPAPSPLAPRSAATPPRARKSSLSAAMPSGQPESLPSQPGAGTGTSFDAGAMVSGRYRLEQKIGQGGMAAVYRAVDNELDDVIAIKFFSHLVADEAMLVRFKSEVSLSRQLNHPNIIRLYDIGTYVDYKYITMELLTGSDLNKTLDGKAIDFDKGLDYLIQACGALALVHDRGVIHRDIKPDNFFITTDGTLKVMDFGIAKRQSAKGLTVAGMIAGTPEYMSPEQINDFGSVTHLTDLYALGCIAYQMFTGTLPFVHQELMPLLVMHVSQTPEPPRARNPRIILELEQVILKLLEKDPTKRIPSCRDLGQKLTEIRRRLPGNR